MSSENIVYDFKEKAIFCELCGEVLAMCLDVIPSKEYPHECTEATPKLV
jgi:hypothetical protein